MNDDLISRQAGLDAIGRVGMCKCSTNEIEAVDECLRAVKALLPATAEPKTDVLDKIRAEIAEYKDDKIIHAERNEMIDIVLDIIDKYKVESEDK